MNAQASIGTELGEIADLGLGEGDALLERLGERRAGGGHLAGGDLEARRIPVVELAGVGAHGIDAAALDGAQHLGHALDDREVGGRGAGGGRRLQVPGLVHGARLRRR
jgi:hypothetical protein